MDDSTPISILQTYLLLSYYEVHCGKEGRAIHTFPNAVIVSPPKLSEVLENQVSFRSWHWN